MARRFAELGIKPRSNREVFDCKQVSITDIINCEIEVLGHIPDVKTRHGDGRCLVHFKMASDGTEGKFFSNSANLKSVLEQIPQDAFPFTTTIKSTKYGTSRMYQFT